MSIGNCSKIDYISANLKIFIVHAPAIHVKRYPHSLLKSLYLLTLGKLLDRLYLWGQSKLKS